MVQESQHIVFFLTKTHQLTTLQEMTFMEKNLKNRLETMELIDRNIDRLLLLEKVYAIRRKTRNPCVVRKAKHNLS